MEDDRCAAEILEASSIAKKMDKRGWTGVVWEGCTVLAWLEILPPIQNSSHSHCLLQCQLTDFSFEMAQNNHSDQVLITSLLKRLWPAPAKENVTATEIAEAISHIFTNSLSPVQTGALLTALHFTGLDRQADVLAQCAEAMRHAAAKLDVQQLREVVKSRHKQEGNYNGGLVR